MLTQAISTKEPDREARQRLLASAAELFAQKGYAATTVREIVAAAGVTPPVLYYYFQNKEGLYLELLRDAWAQVEAALADELGSGGTAREKILRLSERALALFQEKIQAARVMYAVYYGPPQGAPYFDFDIYHVRFRESVLRLVEEGIRSGEFEAADPQASMWALIGALNIAMEVELCHPEVALGTEGLGRVLDVIFRGMSPVEGRSR